MARAKEYKPLLLTTTVRNPQRYKILLNVLLAYNGRILTNEIIDKVISYKRKGYPIMNSVSGLKNMKDLKFKKYCWISNFVHIDGRKTADCGVPAHICEKCGFSMSGEMNAVMSLKPDTIFAGLKLRL